MTRTAVLTRYPHRPPEVGVPSENPNLAEPGLIITDFVDRVGDPVAIVAPDGSSHRADVLMVEALRALFHTLVGGRPSAGPVGVSHPAHWRPAAVDAMRAALDSIPEFRSPVPALLTSDATAALTTLQQEPGVPARGIIAVCDFGASGTSITLADAAQGFAPIGPTVRHLDLSGDLIDQALLTSVISDLSEAGSIDLTGTSAIGLLTRLRAQCRGAKERLSTASVTSLRAALPGSDGEVRVNRNELDEAIRAPLASFVAELQDTLQHSGIRPGELVAVASVGGGARVPIITRTLSEHLRVPVISGAQPELAAAIGAGLKAVRGTVPEVPTSKAPAPAAAVAALTPDPPASPMSSTFRALAWSEADDVPEVAPAEDTREGHADYADYADHADGGNGAVGADGYTDAARPRLAFEEHPPEEHAAAAAIPWYRRSGAILGLGLLIAFAALAALVLFVFRGDESTQPADSTPSATTAPSATTSAAAPPPESPSDAPAPPPPVEQTQTVIEQAPQQTVTVEPPVEQPAPPPAPSEAPPPPPTTTEAAPPPPPEPTQPPSSPPPPVFQLPYSTIPGLPFVPAPIQPQQP